MSCRMVLVGEGLSPPIISSILIIPSNSFVICIFGMQVLSKSLMKRVTTWGLEQMGSIQASRSSEHVFLVSIDPLCCTICAPLL